MKELFENLVQNREKAESFLAEMNSILKEEKPLEVFRYFDDHAEFSYRVMVSKFYFQCFRERYFTENGERRISRENWKLCSKGFRTCENGGKVQCCQNHDHYEIEMIEVGKDSITLYHKNAGGKIPQKTLLRVMDLEKYQKFLRGAYGVHS